MPRKPGKEKALPVGLFIILGTVLIVVGIVWLRGLASEPAYTFTIRYTDPDPLSAGVAVYYRGVKVGRVMDVSLASDFRSTRIKVGVTMDGLRIPVNVSPKIRLEGITGIRYIELEVPRHERVASQTITPGTVVSGAASQTWDELQAQLSKLAEEHTLEKIVLSTEKTMTALAASSARLDGLMDDVKDFIAKTDGSLRRFDRTADAIAQAAGNVGDFSRSAQDHLPQLGDTAGHLDDTLLSVRRAADQIHTTVGAMGSDIRRSGLIPQWAQAGADLSQGIATTESSIQTATGQFSQAGGAFGQTMQSLNQQLLQSNLLPDLSAATDELRKSLQAVAGERASSNFPSIEHLNNQLTMLHQAADTLDQSLDAIPLQKVSVPGRNDLDSLKRLTDLSGQTPDRITPESLAGQAPNSLRRQFEQLHLFGQLLSEALDRLTPTIASMQDLPAQSRQRLLSDMRRLDAAGKGLSSAAADVETNLDTIIHRLPPPRPSLLGSLRNTAGSINRAADRFGCVAAQVNHILSRRFLGFRLFFGQPGGGFDCGQFPTAINNP